MSSTSHFIKSQRSRQLKVWDMWLISDYACGVTFTETFDIKWPKNYLQIIQWSPFWEANPFTPDMWPFIRGKPLIRGWRWQHRWQMDGHRVIATVTLTHSHWGWLKCPAVKMKSHLVWMVEFCQLGQSFQPPTETCPAIYTSKSNRYIFFNTQI